MENAFKAIVKTIGTSQLSKSNNSKYVLCNCELLEGKGKGMIVPVQRTVLTKDGQVKDLPELGQEVVAYHSTSPSREDENVAMHWFEMGLTPMSASQDELRAIFG